MTLARRFNALSLPKLLREMDVYILSLRSRRQNRAWGEAEGGTPGIWDKRTASPRSGRQLFVIRYFSIIEIGQWLSPASRACDINRDCTWGSAPPRSTPGFTL